MHIADDNASVGEGDTSQKFRPTLRQVLVELRERREALDASNEEVSRLQGEVKEMRDSTSILRDELAQERKLRMFLSIKVESLETQLVEARRTAAACSLAAAFSQPEDVAEDTPVASVPPKISEVVTGSPQILTTPVDDPYMEDPYMEFPCFSSPETPTDIASSPDNTTAKAADSVDDIAAKSPTKLKKKSPDTTNRKVKRKIRRKRKVVTRKPDSN